MARPPSRKRVANTHGVPPSAMPFISPSALLYAHLSHSSSTRPTDRLPADARSISLNTSSLTYTNGSSLVRIGDTTVVCGVRAEILPVGEIANYQVHRSTSFASTRKGAVTKEEGESEQEDDTCIQRYCLLVPNIDLSTDCSPLSSPNGPPSALVQSLTTRLASLLHNTRLVSSSSLEIHYTPPAELDAADLPGSQASSKEAVLKAFWVLYIDLSCLSCSSTSATFDAAWLALYAALKDTSLPRAWWDPDLNMVVCSREITEARRLTDEVRGMPVPLSWSVYTPEQRIRFTRPEAAQEKWVLVDPDGFEEGCCDEVGTITVDLSPPFGASGPRTRIVKLEKSGGVGVGIAEVKELVAIAEKRWKEWRDVLHASIKVGSA